MSKQFGGLDSLANNYNAPNLPTGLGGLGLGTLRMPELRNVWYNNQDIKIDGWHFISCRMDNCRLYVSSGNFIFENCFIDENTVIHYQNDAIKIIQLINRANPWMRENHPNFAARVNLDGTITIGA